MQMGGLVEAQIRAAVAAYEDSEGAGVEQVALDGLDAAPAEIVFEGCGSESCDRDHTARIGRCVGRSAGSACKTGAHLASCAEDHDVAGHSA